VQAPQAQTSCASTDFPVPQEDGIRRLQEALGADLATSNVTLALWGAIGPVADAPYVRLYVKLHEGGERHLRLEAKGRPGKTREAQGLVTTGHVARAAAVGADALVAALEAMPPPSPCDKEALTACLKAAIEAAEKSPDKVSHATCTPPATYCAPTRHLQLSPARWSVRTLLHAPICAYTYLHANLLHPWAWGMQNLLHPWVCRMHLHASHTRIAPTQTLHASYTHLHAPTRSYMHLHAPTCTYTHLHALLHAPTRTYTH
jgi:hypothetical protein